MRRAGLSLHTSKAVRSAAYLRPAARRARCCRSRVRPNVAVLLLTLSATLLAIGVVTQGVRLLSGSRRLGLALRLNDLDAADARFVSEYRAAVGSASIDVVADGERGGGAKQRERGAKEGTKAQHATARSDRSLECGHIYLATHMNVTLEARDVPSAGSVGTSIRFRVVNTGSGAIAASQLSLFVRAIGPSVVVGSVVPHPPAAAAAGGAAPAQWDVELTLRDAGAYEIEVIPTWLEGRRYGASAPCVEMRGKRYFGKPVDTVTYQRAATLSQWSTCCEWCQIQPQCEYWVLKRNYDGAILDEKKNQFFHSDQRDAIKWGDCELFQSLSYIANTEIVRKASAKPSAYTYVSGVRNRSLSRQVYLGGLSFGGGRDETGVAAAGQTCRGDAHIPGSPFALTIGAGAAAGAAASSAGDADAALEALRATSVLHRALPRCGANDDGAPGRWIPLAAADERDAVWIARVNGVARVPPKFGALHGAPHPLAHHPARAAALRAKARVGYWWAPDACHFAALGRHDAAKCINGGDDATPPFHALVVGCPIVRQEYARSFQPPGAPNAIAMDELLFLLGLKVPQQQRQCRDAAGVLYDCTFSKMSEPNWLSERKVFRHAVNVKFDDHTLMAKYNAKDSILHRTQMSVHRERLRHHKLDINVSPLNSRVRHTVDHINGDAYTLEELRAMEAAKLTKLPPNPRVLIVIDGFARILDGAEASAAEFATSTAAMLSTLVEVFRVVHSSSRFVYVGGYASHEYPGRTNRAMPRFVEFNAAAKGAIAANNVMAGRPKWAFLDAMAMTLGRPDFRPVVERRITGNATSGTAFMIATAVFNLACIEQTAAKI